MRENCTSKTGVCVLKGRKKRVSITLDDEVIEKLKILAIKDGRSLSGYMNMVIKRYITVKNGDRKTI